MTALPSAVTMTISVSPAATASSTMYWMTGRSMSGTISFGTLFVSGRKRVPKPAASMTALRTVIGSGRRKREDGRRGRHAEGGLRDEEVGGKREGPGLGGHC